jgi:hypothetical protein
MEQIRCLQLENQQAGVDFWAQGQWVAQQCMEVQHLSEAHSMDGAVRLQQTEFRQGVSEEAVLVTVVEAEAVDIAVETQMTQQIAEKLEEASMTEIMHKEHTQQHNTHHGILPSTVRRFRVSILGLM